MAKEWRYLQTIYSSPGQAWEPEVYLTPGEAIAVKREDFVPSLVQEWGVLSLIGDLGAGLAYNTRVASVLCYSAGQVLIVPELFIGVLSPQVYILKNVRQQYVGLSIMKYAEFPP